MCHLGNLCATAWFARYLPPSPQVLAQTQACSPFGAGGVYENAGTGGPLPGCKPETTPP
jgi:hypothetical protein